MSCSSWAEGCSAVCPPWTVFVWDEDKEDGVVFASLKCPPALVHKRLGTIPEVRIVLTLSAPDAGMYKASTIG